MACMCVITGRSSRGAGQDACPLLPQSLSDVGTEHQCCVHPLGLLQQEFGKITSVAYHEVYTFDLLTNLLQVAYFCV